jgi:hypothetical protein
MPLAKKVEQPLPCKNTCSFFKAGRRLLAVSDQLSYLTCITFVHWEIELHKQPFMLTGRIDVLP